MWVSPLFAALTVSVILSEVEGSTSKTFYNTLSDRPFDCAQGDRDIMNREANITVKVLADTNILFYTSLFSRIRIAHRLLCLSHTIIKEPRNHWIHDVVAGLVCSMGKYLKSFSVLF